MSLATLPPVAAATTLAERIATAFPVADMTVHPTMRKGATVLVWRSPNGEHVEIEATNVVAELRADLSPAAVDFLLAGTFRHAIVRYRAADGRDTEWLPTARPGRYELSLGRDHDGEDFAVNLTPGGVAVVHLRGVTTAALLTGLAYLYGALTMRGLTLPS